MQFSTAPSPMSAPLTRRQQQLLFSALQQREPLRSITTAYRIVNGAGDSLPGWTLDRYGSALQLQLFDPQLWPHHQQLADQLVHLLSPHLSITALWIKNRTAPSGASLQNLQPQLWSPSQSPAASAKGRLVVSEGSGRFAVDLSDGANPGLFLDMRHHRLQLATHLSGKTLLNLFAYTGSFGIHAAHAGATTISQVDLSSKILQQAAFNRRLNSLPPQQFHHLRWESRDYLAFAQKRGYRFDAIVLDPPTFSTHRGKTFRVQQQLPSLISASLSLLSPGGILLVGTNCSALTIDHLQQMTAAASRPLSLRHQLLFSGGQDRDFPPHPTLREAHLAVACFQLS